MSKYVFMDQFEKNIKQQLGKIKRVETTPGLFQKIEQSVYQSQGSVVFISIQKMAAAAAILILLNAAVLWVASKKPAGTAKSNTDYTIVSSYNIYSNE